MDIYTVENVTYEGGKVIHHFKDSQTNPYGTTDSEYVVKIEYDKDTGRTEFTTEVKPFNMWHIEELKPRYSMIPKARYTGCIKLPNPPDYELVERDSLINIVSYDAIDYVKKLCDRKGLVPWYGDMTATKNGAITTFNLVTPEQHRRLTAVERERRLKALEHEDD